MSRNVVLVTIDSLRADHCGFMGYRRDTTPTLDRMAREGLAFENAIAPGPSTYESMPAIFTGQFMSLHDESTRAALGTEFLDERMREIELNTHRETIPEWFARQGYATGAFTSNPYTGRFTNFARGFEHYEDFMHSTGASGPIRRMFKSMPVLSEAENAIAMFQGDRASRPWESYYEPIVHWVESVDEPYFLWVFLLEPHTPYLVNRETFSRTDRASMYYHNWKLWATKKWGIPKRLANLNRKALLSLYDMTIRSADRFLDRLLTDLNPTDPSVVVHADHGEAFDEHGIYGHRERLYEENIHVPLVVYNTEFTGIRRSDPISLTAVPDVLRSAASNETTVPSREYVHSRALFSNRTAVRGETWKYVGTMRPDSGRFVDEEVYDLANDPDELVNRIEKCNELKYIGRHLVHERSRQEHEVRSIRRAIAGL